jgi:hypothetical protein
VAAPNLGAVWVSHALQHSGGFYVWDNFTLAEPAAITRLTWRGAYLGPNFINGVANTAYWGLMISSGGATPQGGIWLDFPFPHEVKDNVTLGGARVGGNSVDIHDFEFILPQAVQLPAGSFWLTVLSNVMEPLPDSRFVWSQADDGGSSLQRRWSPGGPFSEPYVSVSGNRAFGLYGAAAVPAPSSLALALVALVLGSGALRRRVRR